MRIREKIIRKININKKYIALIVLLSLMLVIHHYVFIYADDFYYSRDASRGIGYLPKFVLSELRQNGRIWIHLLLLFIVKYDVYLFRIVNPIIVMLSALLLAKISIDSNDSNKNFLIATSCTSALFLFLPAQISSTSIYYAADSLNYLYVPMVVILYAYLFFRDYKKNYQNYPLNLWILILAFFAGSSSQQSGMIAIGFSILILLYFKFFKNNKFQNNTIPYFIAIFVGYSIVSYGSIKRMLYETSVGSKLNLKEAVTASLKTNIFSCPVVFYILAICMCCLFWLLYYSYGKKGSNNKIISIINTIMGILLFLGAAGYAYAIINKKYKVGFFASSNINPILRLCYIGFTAIYLLSLLYVFILILLKEQNPFLLFCGINAFGAQLMLIVVDPKFAGSYRCMFPSLLLMFIFISYSFVKFFNNGIFLSMLLLAFAMSHVRLYVLIAAITILSLSILLKFLSINVKLFKELILSILIASAITTFYVTLSGYKSASYAQKFNLNAIKVYQKSNDKSCLKLKKVPGTIFGYNVTNWNDMPYFMKQCYKIDENTIIEYYK